MKFIFVKLGFINPMGKENSNQMHKERNKSSDGKNRVKFAKRKIEAKHKAGSSSGDKNTNTNSVTVSKSPRAKARKIDFKSNAAKELNNFSDIVVTATVENPEILDHVQVGLNPSEESEFQDGPGDIADSTDTDNESLIDGQLSQQIHDEAFTSPRADHGQKRRNLGLKPDEVYFDQLDANSAFHNYVQKLVAKQVRKEHLKKVDRTPKKGTNTNVEVVKSSSDTTVYAPGLTRILDRENQTPCLVSRELIHDKTPTPLHRNTFNVDDISKFIEGIHIQQEEKEKDQGSGDSQEIVQPGTSKDQG